MDRFDVSLELVSKTIRQGQKQSNPHKTLSMQRNKGIPIGLKDVCNPTVLPHQTKSQRNTTLPIGLKMYVSFQSYLKTKALRVVVIGIIFLTPTIGIHRQSFDQIAGISKVG